jgi:AcrR family transcriptional regulator
MSAVTERESKRRPQGARRRAQLLDALRELLLERELAEVEIADITERAGVVRSLFYFYFPNKPAAVTALLEDSLAELMTAGSSWCEGAGGTHQQRVRDAVIATVEIWRAHPNLFLALFEATGSDPQTRRQWISWTDAFAKRARARIAHDLEAGVALPGIEPPTLAELLSGLTLTAMERDVRSLALTGKPIPGLPEALAHVWYRAIYR